MISSVNTPDEGWPVVTLQADKGAGSDASTAGNARLADPEAKRLAKRLEALHRSVASEARGIDLELYHRAASILRVTLDEVAGTTVTRRGRDDGIAVRTVARDGSARAFAATSGSGSSSLRWALTRCSESPAPDPGESGWERDGAAWKIDHDGEPELPPSDRLAAWLHDARDRLAEGGRGPALLELAVEVASTVESWVGDGGLRASRTRTRGWGILRLREPWAGDRAAHPLLVARRRWQDLRPDAWRAVLEDRRLPGHGDRPPPAGKIPVLFNPECSALLVRSLTKVLHHGGSEPGIEVGPAWKLYDDPVDPEALFGGVFDDSGFPASRKRLANGIRTGGRVGGPGHFRRPSFRDRPAAGPSHLVIPPTERGVPADGVVGTALSVHPVEPDRWVLRIEGALLEGGSPVALLRPSYVSISPWELVRRCVATVGPSRLSHLGVETPALVFAPLSLRT